MGLDVLSYRFFSPFKGGTISSSKELSPLKGLEIVVGGDLFPIAEAMGWHGVPVKGTEEKNILEITTLPLLLFLKDVYKDKASAGV